MKRKTIDILEVKRQLSRLVEEAAAGTEILITIDGRPHARIAAYADASKLRRPAVLKERIKIHRSRRSSAA